MTDALATEVLEAPLGMPAGPGNRIGVLDVGSNSIRLVVYDRAERAPIAIFNEKALCGLGRDLEQTGRLSEEGLVAARQAMARFFLVGEAIGMTSLSILATAAVRDAENGPAFVAEIEDRFGHPVQVLSGNQEARLSALGVASAFPDANGVVGDLGGGSLELVDLRRARVGRNVTLPLGPLRLGPLSARSRSRMIDRIDGHLSRVPWIHAGQGRLFYAVGGAWRSVARAHLAETKHPMEIIHGHRIDLDDALAFLDRLSSFDRREGRDVAGVSRRRIETLAVTSLVLHRVLSFMRPRVLTFSAFGLREGCLFDQLEDDERERDPLLAICDEIARATDRFDMDHEALERWILPFLGTVTRPDRRLIGAACRLSDLGWFEHPTYRGEHAFHRALRLPAVGIEHEERVFLAIAILARYRGGTEDVKGDAALELLSRTRRRMALRVGLALRLAQTLSGGAVQVLEKVRVEADAAGVRLVVAPEAASLMVDTVHRRIAALEEVMGEPIRVVT